MTLPPKSSHRRVLMATAGGALTLVAPPPQMESDVPASFAQFLAIEKARERRRNAEAHETPIRIG